jgi:hypothetical protein
MTSLQHRSSFCPLVLGFIVAALLGGSGTASAAPLNLTQNPPDITSSFISVSYSGGVFTANGFPTTFDIDGVSPLDYSIDQVGPGTPANFNIALTINPATGAAIGGTLNITGKIDPLATSGTLLTGTIANFGFLDPPGGDLFEFEFDLTGGDLLSYFPGARAGVILDAAGTGFNGTFEGEFSNQGSGQADTFAETVPEPSTLGLLGLGFVAFLVGRRRILRRVA